jgi:hypothetical protein
MAGILQNVFSIRKGIYTLKVPENVSKTKKSLINHSALYLGLIVYTAIGAKVGKPNSSHPTIVNTLELSTELDRLETHQALLVSKRVLLRHTLTKQSIRERDEYEYLLVF